MGLLTKLERRRVEVKAHDDFIPADAAFSWPQRILRSDYPFRRDIGDGLDSNVIMAPVNWISRNFTEAETVVQRRDRVDRIDEMGKPLPPEFRWRITPDHPLEILFAEPNDFYEGDMLWKATLVSLLLDGNGYWRKVRNRFGDVIQLWYLPHFLVEPRWPHDGSEFISHYEYRPFGIAEPIRIPVRDMVHYRYGGLDPASRSRKGLSPIKPLLREVFTDEEASNFSAQILRNMGVPGGIISPKDATLLPGDAEVERLKERMKTKFSGDQRGDWLVFGAPTDVKQFGFDPNALNLTSLRDIAEERVCAALGIPAAIVGFGSGLQQTKVGATQHVNKQLAWNACLIPMQNTIRRQATRQLVGDFQSQTRRFRVWFDRSGVAAFEEEQTERARRAALLAEKGIVRVDRAQEMAGVEVDPTQDVYLRPTNTVAVKPDGTVVGKAPENGRPENDEDLLAAIANRVGASRNGD